ncbi:MAG: CHRD domain-containing protein [Noviherbaspirillum sp.]
MHTLSARLFVGCAVVWTLVSCGGHFDDRVALAFSTTPSGREEVPPVASNAFGSAVVTVDLDNGTLIVSIVTNGIADTDAHIHEGAPGFAGPIVFPLARVGGNRVWTASVAINDAQLAALRAGNYYVNVHSAVLPNGEIRGQLFELFPSQDQVNLLRQVVAQSPLVRQQLRQLQDIDDWRHRHFTGVGIRLTFGF